MGSRSAELQEFVAALQDTFSTTKREAAAAGFLERAFSRLKTTGEPSITPASRLDVCRYLPEAYCSAKSTSPEIRRLIAAFEKIEPLINWEARTVEGPFASENWAGGHGDAVILGVKGIEYRTDVTVGVTILEPHVRYPDHSHAPEEVYLVLTWGSYQHGKEAWTPIPSGTIFHNVPRIKHAMASATLPLLAIWVLIME